MTDELQNVHKFTLTDRDGKPHDYVCSPFGVEGIDLVIEIRAMAAEPLGRILGSMGVLDAVSDRIRRDGLDTDLGALVGDIARAGIPWAEIAGDIKAALRAAGGAKLIRRILAQTYRDGERLSEDRAFAKAYQRNWNEMFLAAWNVAQWNDLLGFTFTSTDSPDSAGVVGVPSTSVSNERLDALG